LKASGAKLNQGRKIGLSFAPKLAAYSQVLAARIQAMLKIDLALILTDLFTANALFVSSTT
jgi:hypothetical protein